MGDKDEDQQQSSSSEWWDRLSDIGSPSLLLLNPLFNDSPVISPQRLHDGGWSPVDVAPRLEPVIYRSSSESWCEIWGVRWFQCLPTSSINVVSPLPPNLMLEISIVVCGQKIVSDFYSCPYYPEIMDRMHTTIVNEILDHLLSLEDYDNDDSDDDDVGFLDCCRFESDRIQGLRPLQCQYVSSRRVEEGLNVSYQCYIEEDNFHFQMDLFLEPSYACKTLSSATLLFTLLDVKFTTMMECYPKEEIRFVIAHPSLGEKIDSSLIQFIWIPQPPRSSLRSDAFPNGRDITLLDSSEQESFLEVDATIVGGKVSGDNRRAALSCSKKKNSTETRERNCRTKHMVTLDNLKQLFGLKRVDAAKALGVSVPTFKRYCRKNGIKWWNGGECSLLEPKLVIIKAKYGEDIVKFQFSPTSGVVELKEQVAKRLELEFGSFNIKYQDEDKEWILITCDEDVENCVKLSHSIGNQPIRLLVSDKVANFGNSRENQRA